MSRVWCDVCIELVTPEGEARLLLLYVNVLGYDYGLHTRNVLFREIGLDINGDWNLRHWVCIKSRDLHFLINPW